MNPTNTVIFRKFKKEGDVIALFPNIPADHKGNCMSYQHVGQHGAADYRGCIKSTVPATPEEYNGLEKELRNIGYDLVIRKRS